MSYTDIVTVLMCSNDCHDIAQAWLDDIQEEPEEVTLISYINITSLLAAA